MDRSGGSLTEDLLIPILKTLPVKSLLRFTCVSKPWSHLISDPHLVTSHLRFNKSSSHSSLLGVVKLGRDRFSNTWHEEILIRIDNNAARTTFPFPWSPRTASRREKPRISILVHCNGLFLAFSAQTHLVYEHAKAIPKEVHEYKYIICNPIARRFQILPESDIELPDLTFEDYYPGDRSPKHTMSTFGLGFIDNLVYKIVRVTYGVTKLWFKAYEPARAEVYDSISGRWREVPVNDDLSYEDLERGVYNSFDGCLYWFGRGYGEIRERYFTLVSFHLVDEIWRETLLPYKSRSWTPGHGYEDQDDGVFGEYGVCEHVGILGESIVMLVGDLRDRLVWNVWKMNKEDDRKVSWTYMYVFDFEGTPQGFCRDGRLLLSKRDGSLVLHDSGKMDDACFGFTVLVSDVVVLGFDKRLVVIPEFFESLLLLDGESPVVEEDASELEEPKSFWEEDEDLGDLTSVFDDNL